MTKRPSDSRCSRRFALMVALGVVATGIATFFVVWKTSTSRSRGAAERNDASIVGTADSAVPPLGEDGAALSSLAQTVASRDWQALVDAGQVAASAGPDAARSFVLQLFAALDRMSPADRLSTVIALMDSGRDVRLGKAFKPGAGGFLTEWPTLRIALIDYLSQRDSVAARLLAEEILESRPEEPGEWSLALRELVRGAQFEELPDNVVNRIHDLLSDATWNADSQPSWLEGFDVVVATKSPTYLTDLSAITKGRASSRAAQFAAFLTADRLALAAPREMLAALNGDVNLFDTEPTIRAGLFARADVRDSEQLKQLQSYFERADVPAAERAAFADLFPLYDLAVSQNILTRPASRNMHDMMAHDRAAVAAIDHWLGDPLYSKWHDALRQVRERLSAQLAQVGR